MSLTIEQFNKLATKVEFHELDVKVNHLTDNVQTILSAVDGLTKEVRDFKTELHSNQAAHDRIQEKVDDHGVRINKLELNTN